MYSYEKRLETFLMILVRLNMTIDTLGNNLKNWPWFIVWDFEIQTDYFILVRREDKS